MSEAEENSGQKKVQLSAGGVVFNDKIVIFPQKRLSLYDNGGVQAFEASGNHVAFVSDKKDLPRLSQISGYVSLSDTTFLKLVAANPCYWPPAKAQRFVLIYRNEADTKLKKSLEPESHDWKQAEIVDHFIRPVIRALKEMKERSFFHGAIRADNIFYAKNQKSKGVILGDPLSVCASSTQPALYETIERALADPYGRGVGENSDDIYSFGVALAVFLQTSNHLAGLSSDQIIKLKINQGSYVAIVGKERYSPVILNLLRGLLHDDPTLRWGIEELFAWLEGGRLNPPTGLRRKTAMRPITFMGERYLFARNLSVDLHKNPQEALQLINSGELEQWLDKSLSEKDIHERYLSAIAYASAKASSNYDLLISVVKTALDPDLPFYYKGLCMHYGAFGDALAYAFCENKSLGVFAEILNLNICVNSIYVKGIEGSYIVTTIRKFENARMTAKNAKPSYGLERVVYMLAENVMCLGDKFKDYMIRGRNDILDALEEMSAASENASLVLDRHAIAFIATVDGPAIDGGLFDLSSTDRDKVMYGNLKIIANIQKRIGGKSYPHIAKIMLKDLEIVFEKFHNKILRKKIYSLVSKAANEGNLFEMLSYVEDPNLNKGDQKGFIKARLEYQKLQKEYVYLEHRMKNSKRFGLAQGRSMSAVIGWFIAISMTAIVVLSFLSGNSFF